MSDRLKLLQTLDRTHMLPFGVGDPVIMQKPLPMHLTDGLTLRRLVRKMSNPIR